MAPTALVIGGTGPTGPGVVRGLVDRDYDVTILHGGQHEVDLPDEVGPHIHVDPHFAEPLAEGIGDRSFDLVVAQYGRLSIIAEMFRGRTERLVAIGGATGSIARNDDPRWGRLGRPAVLTEEQELLETDIDRNKFGFRMAEAERALFAGHEAGGYRATYLAYPVVYGPRQLAPNEWSIIRRILDGRRRMVIADGGVRVESRLFTENAIHGVLLAIDNPDAAEGEKFVVTDDAAFSMRQRIEFVAAHMGASLELVDMPYEVATPCHAYWRRGPRNLMRSNAKIKRVLGYADVRDPDEALTETLDWLLANRPEPGGDVESRLGDAFDYDSEDALMDEWLSLTERVSVTTPVFEESHPYRHPKRPGESWTKPNT